MIRNQKVILDSDLASLYGVKTKNLNKAVQRNIDRFPAEFMFQLTKSEAEYLRSRFQIGTLNEDQVSRSQIATLKKGQNLRFQFGTANFSKRRFLPYAFTEHGALMAATVLNSPRAVAMSIAIIKTFVKLRQILSLNSELAHRLDDLEKKYGENFQIVFGVIEKLAESVESLERLKKPVLEEPEEPKKEKIGFHE